MERQGISPRVQIFGTDIGLIMLATGAAQLITAPIAVALERRVDAGVLTAAGFLVFGLGVGLSAFQTTTTDAASMFWPQIIRGIAIMFCLLPPTRRHWAIWPPRAFPTPVASST